MRCRTLGVPSAWLMTGNLTNAVLAFVDSGSRTQPLMESDITRLQGALRLPIGFFLGCVAAAAAVTFLGDWTWSLPAALAGVAVSLARRVRPDLRLQVLVNAQAVARRRRGRQVPDDCGQSIRPCR